MVAVLLRRLAEAVERLEEQPGPALEHVVVVELRDHLRLDVDVELLDLNIPDAGLQVRQGLRVERRPVRDAALEVADVDEVEVLRRPGPRQLLDVVDLELAVGRDPCGLRRGDVDADYLCGGELVGEVAGCALALDFHRDT